jgi:hypothetical protein
MLRNTSDQLVQSRKQELWDGRLVRHFVAEDQIDRRRISVQRLGDGVHRVVIIRKRNLAEVGRAARRRLRLAGYGLRCN